MKAWRHVALAAIAGGLLAPPAAAQVGGYAVDRYEASEPGSDWFTTESLDLRGRARLQAGVVGDWAYRPVPGIVDQVFVHHRASLVLVDQLRIGVSAPIGFYRDGEPAAFGDLRLGVDTRLFHSFVDRVRGAVGFQVFLPTGTRASFSGDGTIRFAPRLLLAGSRGAFDWAFKAGVAVRPSTGTFAGRALGSDVFAAVSAGIKVNDRFVIGPELHGTATITGPDALAARAVPIELLLGGRVRIGDDVQAGTAIGGGLNDADGAPVMRVLAMLEWAPDACVDKDGDGICAPYDACPEVAGPRSRNRRTNGCPVE